ncbi:MAG TPA: PqiC family protein [Rhodanobacteraceae bacterium]|nr:PqiC family protein [Rhodanobacteraceae bacterium]
MMRLVRYLSIAGLGMWLAGCSSAPMHFYTLVPPDHAAPVAATTASYRIAVLPVTIPAQVDQPQMVVREGASSVALLEGQRWIAPLGDEIRMALSDALVRELGAQDIYGLASGGDEPVYRIKVNVDRFESVPGSHTLLVASWSVHGRDDKRQVLQCSSRIRETVGPGYAALVGGHQHALQTLAGRIATAVRGMAEGGAGACP